jgi:hypothetical protein
VNAALVAIGGLVLLAGLGWWAYARSQKRSGSATSENKTLKKGAEVLDGVLKILARPVAFGGRLRAGLLARAKRHELPESDDLPETSAPAGDADRSRPRNDVDT